CRATAGAGLLACGAAAAAAAACPETGVSCVAVPEAAQMCAVAAAAAMAACTAGTYRDRALADAGVTEDTADVDELRVHHIVQKEGDSFDLLLARKMLANAGIGIHDLENLVVMDKYDHFPLHTNEYRAAVAASLFAGWTLFGGEGVRL